MAKSVVPKHIIKFIPPRSEVANLSYKEREALAVGWDSFSPKEKRRIGQSINDTMLTTAGYEVKDPKALERLLAK
jgi:hypothetical protein